MTRFLVPAVLAATISGLAFTLIVIVIAQSPYTHANLRTEGYERTEIAHLGEEYSFAGQGLADRSLSATGDPAQDGRALFFQYGCASCHGLRGTGATLGEDLDAADLSPSAFRRKLRKGPKGMPPFNEGILSDEDRTKIYAFLEWARQEETEQAAAEINESETNP